MENTNDLFYKQSNKVKPLGILIAFLVMIIVVFSLAFVYSKTVLFIPIIYLNFLFTTGFGIVLGVLSRVLVRVTHNRNRKNQLLQAVFIGLLANYFQWAIYILMLFGGGESSFWEIASSLKLVFFTPAFFDAIVELSNYGSWSLFGMSFNGYPLIFVWVLEFFIILAIPVFIFTDSSIYPYAESSSKWYPKYTLKKDFESVALVKQLLNNLQIDPLQTIGNLGAGNGLRHTKIHVFFLVGNEEHFLTFEKIFIEGRGKGKKNRNVIVNNFKVDTRTAKLILETYENKRERFDVF